jgi:hypothetical protein
MPSMWLVRLVSSLQKLWSICGMTDRREPDYRKWRSDRHKAAVAGVYTVVLNVTTCLEYLCVSGLKKTETNSRGCHVNPSSRCPKIAVLIAASGRQPPHTWPLFCCHEKKRGEWQTVAEAVHRWRRSKQADVSAEAEALSWKGKQKRTVSCLEAEISVNTKCICGHAVAQMVEVLRYKPPGGRFDSRWCHWKQKWVPGIFPGGLSRPVTEFVFT